MKRQLCSYVLPLLLLLLTFGPAHAQTSKVTYVYTDPQGTPLAEADAQGNITAAFDYRPFGSQALGQAPSGPGYTGHVTDPDSGLVYMQARYYDPSVGRFLSVDPIGPSGGDLWRFNRFSYANNNPVRFVDPDGRESAQLSLAGAQALTEDVKNYDARTTAIALGAASVLPGIGDVPAIGMAVASPSIGSVSAAVVGLVPIVGPLAGDAIRSASVVDRVKVLASTMSSRTQRSVTLAITETQEGTRLVSSSEGALRPATRAALVEGEVAVKGVAGTHAEVNGINAAKKMGLTPTGTAASRPICSSCAQYLRGADVKPLSSLKE